MKGGGNLNSLVEVPVDGLLVEKEDEVARSQFCDGRRLKSEERKQANLGLSVAVQSVTSQLSSETRGLRTKRTRAKSAQTRRVKERTNPFVAVALTLFPPKGSCKQESPDEFTNTIPALSFLTMR